VNPHARCKPWEEAAMRFFTQLTFVFVFVLVSSSTVQADSRLTSEGKALVAEVQATLFKCILDQQTANMHYKFDEMAAYERDLDKLYKCKSEGLGQIKASVQELRIDLRAQNKSEAPLKDFMMTYQKIIGVLGDTSNDQANQYVKLLAIKGEAIAAELEW
jgi:hypothetical protein